MNPFWVRSVPKPRFDIARLMPATSCNPKGFETFADASTRSTELIARLEGAASLQNRRAAVDLGDCLAGDFRCELPLCPICGRHYRIWFTGQVLRAIEHTTLAEHRIMTVHLGTYRSGHLHEAHLAHARDQLRKRLARAGFAGAAAIGGLEAAYRAETDDWLLHAHVLVMHAAPMAVRRLREVLGPSNCRAQNLADPPRQISYLQKFSTGHRPGEQHGPCRARMFPLPNQELEELVNWMSRYDFADFLFLFGARRRGDTLRLIDQ
jgi:hypothetical protein